MGKTRQTNQRNAENTKKELLKAAEVIFVDKGFDAARVDEIAKAAGCNKRLIYIYFGSKKDIYFEVLRSNLAKISEAGRSLVDETQKPYDQAMMFLRWLFEFLSENLGFVRLLGWQSLGNQCSKKQDRELVNLLSSGLEDMKNVLDRGVKEGTFRPDLDVSQLMLTVIGLCLAYSQRRLLREAIWDLDLSDSKKRGCAKPYH